jgi:hypothetical protein
MAATLLGHVATGFAFALTAETGINIESFTQSFRKKKKEIPNHTGETAGLIYYDPMSSGTVTGEVSGSTGVAAAEPGVSLTIANIISGHGVAAGLVFCDEVTREKGREDLSKITVPFSRYPLITT